MKPRLIAIFVVIVCAPLVVLAVLGVKVVHSERHMIRARFQELLETRLRDIDGQIGQLMATRERELISEEMLAPYPAEDFRDRMRRSGVVRQYFALNPQGELTYPAPGGFLTDAEKAFLRRTENIWMNREIPGGGADGLSGQSIGKAAAKQAVASGAPQQGWHVWYWGGGLNLMFWWRDELGNVAGAELNPVRLMADIVGILPDTVPAEAGLPEGRFMLRNTQGEVIYQWGPYDPPDAEPPRATLPLSPPLGAWRLDCYMPGDLAGVAFGRSTLFNLMSGLAFLTAAVIGLALYFFREHTRELREASQRVSFVNQVSHELKTPLTNIRMYAEMLDYDLSEADAAARSRLGVIVSESQRLSRLIGNVLTFARKQRSTLKLHTSEGSVDELLDAAVGHFEPALRAKGVEVVFERGAPHGARFDHDALEQIVANLLSNIEKYAAGATRADVASRQEGDNVHITVADDGPGISKAERERIFEPFHRVSNRVNDGVAGTGIGLAIARDLARLHGGDLTLEPADGGAMFRLEIHAPRTNAEEP